jgi:hypothetical protein
MLHHSSNYFDVPSQYRKRRPNYESMAMVAILVVFWLLLGGIAGYFATKYVKQHPSRVQVVSSACPRLPVPHQPKGLVFT